MLGALIMMYEIPTNSWNCEKGIETSPVWGIEKEASKSSDRTIPAANIDLHYAHCSRNLERCKVCRDMIPTRHAEEHYLNTHAPVACSLCSETVDREILALHKGENCPRRIVTCEYCEFPLPAVDLLKHQEVCGNRTEYCPLCSKYVRLRERLDHDIRFHGTSDSTAGPSRDGSAAEREQGAQRRQPNGYSQRRLLFTIAITGIAVLLGSIFLQRKGDNQQMQPDKQYSQLSSVLDYSESTACHSKTGPPHSLDESSPNPDPSNHKIYGFCSSFQAIWPASFSSLYKAKGCICSPRKLVKKETETGEQTNLTPVKFLMS
ncbi:hypothetical protein BVC80_5g29 [Macleaya cordata]|uniref:XIAP-associated factor 1 n=1 Tax=Macleaya cordata TaxID=56857 RepID=A0A200QXR4_MACCD|nr:hypothetical protein BVC80_5g29 [Macleaya cordata]